MQSLGDYSQFEQFGPYRLYYKHHDDVKYHDDNESYASNALGLAVLSGKNMTFDFLRKLNFAFAASLNTAHLMHKGHYHCIFNDVVVFSDVVK